MDNYFLDKDAERSRLRAVLDAEQLAHIRTKSELVECRIALLNSEACRAQAENDSIDRDIRHEKDRKTLAAMKDQRNAARADAGRLAGTVTDFADWLELIAEREIPLSPEDDRRIAGLRSMISTTLAAHAQAVTK